MKAACFPPRWRRGICLLAAGIATLGDALAIGFPIAPPTVLINGKANVLFILDNSNSMDEAPSGAAAGSNSPNSKSEIARRIARSLLATYTSRINLGLMSYRLGATQPQFLHNSGYDVSYNPANYNAAFTGNRASQTKRFSMPNPTDPGRFVYYNVALPFYTGGQVTAHCYSATADASANANFPNGFNNGESPTSGPWDNYDCYAIKTGLTDEEPSIASSGYANLAFGSGFNPTDSDFAQGILDFGKRLSFTPVALSWFVNNSPGRGFLHVPIQSLEGTQIADILNKLECNVPAGDPLPPNALACNANGIMNAGLTPMQGTLLTARDYFAGGWNNADEGYVSSCYPLPVSCDMNFVVLLTDGMPSTDKDGNTISDPAAAIAGAAAAAQSLRDTRVLTYIVGFALPTGVSPTTLNTIAAAGGTTSAFLADDETTLTQALNQVFDDIANRVGAASNVTAKAASLSTSFRLYQAIFNTEGWTGDLLSRAVDASFQVVWRASTRMPEWSSRNIWTRNSATSLAVRFNDRSNLSATQQTQLAASATEQVNMINYLRGDTSREKRNGGSYRNRQPLAGNPAATHLLGDIIHSSPVYDQNRGVIYLGGNDGMLHAFSESGGNEIFAYLPAALMSRVNLLSNPNYVHEYFVDGEIDINGNTLVAALGHGGKGLFALNVANPSGFGSNDALWEYTGDAAPSNDATYGKYMGLVLGQPRLVKTNDGAISLLVPNGYNSTKGTAALIVMNPTTGAIKKVIDTNVALDNGLAGLGVFDADGNGTVDAVYGGDLKGNVWKFDLGSSNPSSWDIAYRSGGTPVPLFVARNSGGATQPITAPLSVATNTVTGDPNFGKTFVFFGTGSLMTSDDRGDTSRQTLYGLIDTGSTISGRTALRERTVVDQGMIGGTKVRVFSQSTSGDMTGKRGWFIDLPDNGERIIARALFVSSGTVEPILETASVIPSVGACTNGGSGYINIVSPFTGARTTNAIFDVNGDGKIDSGDLLNGYVVGSISPSAEEGIPGAPVFIGGESGSGGSPPVNFWGGSSGGVGHVAKAGGTPFNPRRMSWREIIRD